MNSENTFIGSITLIKQSFAFYKKYTKEIVLLLLAPAVLLAILAGFQTQFETLSQFELVNNPSYIFAFAGVVIASVLLSCISMILLSVFLVHSRTEIVPLKKAFKISLKLLLPVLGFGVLFYLIVIGGFIGFIVPGIMLSLGLMFGLFLIIEGKPIREALVASWHMTDGVKLRMLVRIIILGVLNAVVSIVIGALVSFALPTFAANVFFGLIVNLIITPIYFGAIFFLYEHVRSLPSVVTLDAFYRKRAKRMFIIVGSAGILMLVVLTIILVFGISMGILTA